MSRRECLPEVSAQSQEPYSLFFRIVSRFVPLFVRRRGRLFRIQSILHRICLTGFMKTLPFTSYFQRTRRLARMCVPPMLATSVVVLSSCQVYRPAPLDPDKHAASWRDRSPSDGSVREFARRLSFGSTRSVRFNPGDGLARPEGEVVAIVYNPDLRIARIRAGVAKAVADHAGRWDDPKLSIDVLRVKRGVPHPWTVGSALSLTLPVSGRLQVEKSRAVASHHVELSRVAEAEWEVVRDLRKAWLEWSANRLRLEESERISKSLDALVKSTGKLAEKGEMPRTESTLFEIEQKSRKVEIARLRGLVESGEQEIRMLMGISPSAPARLKTSLFFPEGKRRGSLAENNPTLARLRQSYIEAELTLMREIRKQYPDLEIGPQMEDDQGQSKIGMIGAIPVPILNSNKGGISAARAQREVGRAAFETELEKTEGRLAAARARAGAARKRRQYIDASVVPLVDRQLVDAQRLLTLGEGSSLVLLESLVRAHKAKLDLIEVRLEESLSKNEIQFLLGPDRVFATTK